MCVPKSHEGPGLDTPASGWRLAKKGRRWLDGCHGPVLGPEDIRDMARKCAEMQTCVLTLSLGRRTGSCWGSRKRSEESAGICKEERKRQLGPYSKAGHSTFGLED